jgi:hypothetical protein
MGQLSSARYSPAGRRWVQLGSRSARPRVKQSTLWPEPKESETLPPGTARWDDLAETATLECEAKDAGIPEENIAAIQLLESWLRMPSIEGNDFGERLRRRIDENRLSDRKFFT